MENTYIKTQIQGDLNENPTGQALADLIHKEQKILAKEVRWLQDKAWKARKRASERREHRNKNQNSLLGIKKITGKYNTSKPLTEVKISCPCGLKWKWQAAFPDGIGREARALDWIQKCTANFRTHSLRTTQEGLEIQLETLTDMLPLLQATQNPPPEIGSRSLVYNLGP